MNKTDIKNKINNNLFKKYKESGITQDQLCNLTGINKYFFKKLLINKFNNINIKTYLKINIALDNQSEIITENDLQIELNKVRENCFNKFMNCINSGNISKSKFRDNIGFSRQLLNYNIKNRFNELGIINIAYVYYLIDGEVNEL